MLQRLSFALLLVLLLLAGPLCSPAQERLSLRKAQAQLENGATDAAGATLEALLRVSPSSADAWSLLGVVHAQQNDPAKAEACFRKALSFRPRLIPAEMNLGHLLLDQHREDEAWTLLSAAVRQDPGNGQLKEMATSAAEAMALRQRSAGDRNGALQTLLTTTKQLPDNFRLLLDLSILEDDLRLFKDAERDVHEARLLQPADAKALYAEARVQMDMQKMPVAEEDMRAYLKMRPDDPTAHYGLGRILQISEHKDEAKVEFERSIALAPNQAESYYQIGQMALDQGDYALAQRECRIALEHDPKHGGALAVLGIAAYRLKQYPDAVQSLRAAITAAPDYQTAHYYYGLALGKTGQQEESARELKLAAQMADEQNHREAQRYQLAPSPQP